MKLNALATASCLFVFATLFFFSSCSDGPDEDRGLVIGFSVASDDFLLERWNRDIKIFTSRAADLGAEVILAKSPGDARNQIPQIQFLLDEDVDVIVVIPQDMELLGGVIQKALDRQIPVISYDRPVMDVAVSGYVSFDNKRVGQLLAESVLSSVPTGRYLVVNGSTRDNNSYEINRGITGVLEPSVASGEVQIVDQIWLNDWSFDEALVKIDQAFNTYGEVDAVICANDVIANAAVQLLSQRRLAGEVAVVGQDADLLACQRIIQGTQLMTVYKPIADLAGRAAELAVDLAKGVMPEADVTFDNRTVRGIPFYREEPIAVTRENMDETVILDGFHLREDVYRD